MTNNSLEHNLLEKQKIIYGFFAEIVQEYPALEVLKEFQGIFFNYYSYLQQEQVINAIYQITISRDQEIFLSTLKQVSYLLINNWLQQQEYGQINKLVRSFIHHQKKVESFDQITNRRNTWIRNFVKSQDYQDLQAFIYQNQQDGRCTTFYWTEKYRYYSLVNQYSNQNNFELQKEAAQILAAKLRSDFKFQLARYITYTQSGLNREYYLHNPTHLGQQLIDIIRTLIVRKSKLNYANLAKIFQEQIPGIEYGKFKNSLHAYIMFSLKKNEPLELFREKLYMVIQSLVSEENNKLIKDDLVFNSCQVLIEQLTVTNSGKIGDLFKLVANQLNPITFAIILIKIVLISPHSRVHLENKFAHLIKIYQKRGIPECQWLITCLDLYNIIFSIYDEPNIEYNLVKRNNNNSELSLENNEYIVVWLKEKKQKQMLKAC